MDPHGQLDVLAAGNGQVAICGRADILQIVLVVVCIVGDNECARA